MKKINPTAYAVLKLYGGRRLFFGWADFKHRLYKAGVLESTAAPVPAEWVDAFQRARGRQPPSAKNGHQPQPHS